MVEGRRSGYAGSMELPIPPSAGAERAFGPQLRAWRMARGQSQLSLALTAGVSTRHVSYLETGRASPSREMVLTLSQAMDVPLRSRNQLLMAAGFAPLYRETPMNAPAMGPVSDALQFLLGAMEPNATFVVNRRYDVIDANRTGQWILSTFTAELERFARPYNLALLLIRPQGMRPYLENWDEVARKVLGRLRRDLGGAQARGNADDALLSEVEPLLARMGVMPVTAETPSLMIGVRLRRGELALNLFTTITTLGTAQDVTLQEMRIETLFPADATTKEFLATREARGLAVP